MEEQKIVKSDALRAAMSEVKTKVDSQVADAKSYADTKIAELVGGAPETLDTLKEISDALGADANLSATLTAEIGKKADTSALEDYQKKSELDTTLLTKYPKLASLDNFVTKSELSADFVKASELNAMAMSATEARAIVTEAWT